MPAGADGLINGRYRLIEVIGQGAMGTVWHGHDEMLDREVAIKKIHLSSDLDGQERAELKALAMREARATAGLSHPGVITVYDVIEHHDACGLATTSARRPVAACTGSAIPRWESWSCSTTSSTSRAPTASCS
jgi:serine/threonine protein kinase